MHRGIILVVTMLAVLAAFPAVRGTAHLTFDNTTEANVTREGCDMSVLCLELPEDCDPEGNTACLFTSLNATAPMAPDGFNLSVGLSGNSSELIAFGLTQNFSEGVTQLFVCGMNGNGTFFFQTLERRENGTLTPNERITTQIRNRVEGNSIQCEFTIPNVNTSLKGETLDGTTAVVILGNGMVNQTSALTESFDARLNSNRVNLTDAQGTVILPKILNINRDGCGNEKLCIESPKNCDPQSTDTCLFTSLDTTTPADETFNISVELAGESTGYIAMGFTQNASEGVTNLYICGINSSDGNSFTFRTLDRNNTDDSLTEVERQVADLCGVVNGMSIQCTFTIVDMNATAMTRETGTVNSILLGNGTINGSVIETFNVVRDSGPLDVTDPAANINNSMLEVLALNITREGCGETNLCVEIPNDCDPLTNNMCQFMSSNVTVSTMTNVFNMTVRLSGYSMGYFALGLAQNASEGTSSIFACGNDTGGPFLRTFTRNNTDGNFTSNDRGVTGARFDVSGRSIECEFTILNLNDVETRETDGVIADVILGNGTVNGTMLNSLTVLLVERVTLTTPTGEIAPAEIENGARAGRSSDAMLILMSLVTLLAALQG
ncbi:uncharacterized protein LOC133411621 [Phycodurus eques]|uniref:uncharacterized protein LOC133411621 n=1 Tax=Phycodurus eques TaxID=693459 RepID=UPI002ACD3A53|nr:uncharacterized protein LOC133411621 [Phycodurus eques]